MIIQPPRQKAAPGNLRRSEGVQFPFYNSWTHHKIKGFPVFLGSLKWALVFRKNLNSISHDVYPFGVTSYQKTVETFYLFSCLSLQVKRIMINLKAMACFSDQRGVSFSLEVSERYILLRTLWSRFLIDFKKIFSS